jgi:hypothetical protein
MLSIEIQGHTLCWTYPFIIDRDTHVERQIAFPLVVAAVPVPSNDLRDKAERPCLGTTTM